jgi:ring-1,2-phenylacetyl-CoA epoxidase subunit PaaE
MPRVITEMPVTEVTEETHDVKTFHLEWPSGTDFIFKTGQFITIYFADDTKVKRAYSLSSCQFDRGYFEITVKKMGFFGTKLWETVKVGTKLMVIPPTGNFTLPSDTGKDLILIAGGSGVTPYRGFVRHCNEERPETKVTILYSVRVPEDTIFRKEFEQLELANPNFKFKVTCTRATPEQGYTGKWEGHRGRINAEWIKEQVRHLPSTVFYACGPTELVKATEQLVVEEMGIPKEQMRTEKWG